MVRGIVCVDRNMGIGKDGKLLVRSKEDMKCFKQFTTGGIVIMGRKTFDEMGRKPLVDRVNLVITRGWEEMNKTIPEYLRGEKATKTRLAFCSIESAKCICFKDTLSMSMGIKESEDVWIIGGGSIYKELSEHIDEWIITKVDAEFEADTFLDEEVFNELFSEGYGFEEDVPLVNFEEGGLKYSIVKRRRKEFDYNSLFNE